MLQSDNSLKEPLCYDTVVLLASRSHRPATRLTSALNAGSAMLACMQSWGVSMSVEG